MDFLQSIKKSVRGGLATLEEKNRKRAHLNRIREAMRREEKAARQEYIALGRYYFHHLRDKNNLATEPHCVELEKIEKRLDTAITQLENAYAAHAAALTKNSEEVTLEDVECLEEEPVITDTPAAPEAVAAEKAKQEAADLDENGKLPFADA